MKRNIALFLVLLLSVSTLAACATKSTSSSSSAAAPAESSSQSASTAPAEDKDIPTVIWWNTGDMPVNAEAWLETVNAYLEEEIGIRVDYKTIPWGDWPNKHTTIINSGEYFDIMFTDLSIYNQFVDLGAFADLTALLPTAAPELQAYIPADVWKGVTNPKGIFAIPTVKDTARTDFNVFDYQYIEKYNIDYENIVTMEDLDGYFRTVKAGEGASFYPLQMTTATHWAHSTFNDYDGLGASLPPIGVHVKSGNLKVVNTLEQEDIQKTLSQLHTWFTDGIINPDANVQTEQNLRRPFFRGIGWPGAISIWQVSEGVEKYVSTRAFGPMYTTDSIQGSLNSISANSQYKEESLRLLEHVNVNHKARDMFAFGIEGENFEYVEPNVVRVLNDSFGNMSRYSQATFFTMSTVEGSQKDQWDEVRQQNAEAFSSPMLGFTLDLETIRDEVAACNTVWEKYRNDLLTGAVNPEETIPQVIEELKVVGLDKIIEEAQRQIDAL